MRVRSAVVIGAGLSGLVCAEALEREGVQVKLLEASDGAGGRVRTDVVEGFQLDRGYQVMFPEYPALKSVLDVPALNLKEYLPGALILHRGKQYRIGDPLRVPEMFFETALSSLFPLGDKYRIWNLSRKAKQMSLEEIFKRKDCSMEEYLREEGFTDAALDRFFRPFYAGIFLDPDLETSSRMFLFIYKMLSQGPAAVPEAGMGAMAEQIASRLKPGTIRLNCTVQSLKREAGRVTGIQTADGETLEADVTVLAADMDAAAALSGVKIEGQWRSSTTLYFALPASLYSDRLVGLFTSPDRVVNNIAQVTNAAPSYAPAGQHLLACSVCGLPDCSDEALAEIVKSEIADAFPGAKTDTWRQLKVYRIPKAQFVQSPGFNETRPALSLFPQGLVPAGEYMVSSSLQGAFLSGRLAAEKALNDRK